MRIVHISDCYLPKLGGIEIQVAGLAEAQLAAGHEVHVITATRLADDGRREDSIHGVQVHRLTMAMPRDLPVHPLAGSVIRRRLEQMQPDVVHVHVGAVSQFAWAGLHSAHRLGLPALSTVHSMWGPLARLGYRAAALLVDWPNWGAISAVSRAAAAQVQLAAGREVLLTGNGVDLDAWRAPAHSPNAELHFVSATRFAPRKRVWPLLRAARELHHRLGADCPRFTIAGSGPAYGRARDLVARWGLDNLVKLPGRLRRDELQSLYARADLFVQLSVRESFGLAAIEARAAGLPVVGRRGNGFAEFVTDGVTGRLTGSDAAAVDALEELARDRSALARLQAASHASPPVNSWQHATEAVEIAYEAARSARLR